MNGRVEAGWAGPVPFTSRQAPMATLGGEAQFIRWGVLACAGVLLAIPFGTFVEWPPDVVVLGTAVGLFFLAAHGYSLSKRQGENVWLAPVSLLGMFFFFKYGWGALVVYYWDVFPWETVPAEAGYFLRNGVKDNLPRAAHLMLLGGLGIYLGASGTMPAITRWLPSLKWPFDESKFQHNLILATPIALLVFIGMRPYLPAVIRDTVLHMGWIVWVFIVIASYRLFLIPSDQRRTAWTIFLVAVTLVHAILGFQTGMRGNFLYPLFLISLGYVIARGSVPWRLLLPVVLLLGLVAIPWLSAYKQAVMGESAYAESMNARLLHANELYEVLDLRGSLESSLVNTAGRFAGSSAGALAVFSQFYPEPYPFEKGHTFVLELTQLMPRVVWPDKPNLSFELNQYTRAVHLLPEANPDDPGTTSATFDAISEYYLNFGALGVFLFSVLHGYFLKVLYYWLVRRSHYEIGAAMYLVFFFLNPDFLGIGNISVSATRLLVAWPVMFWVMSRKT